MVSILCVCVFLIFKDMYVCMYLILLCLCIGGLGVPRGQRSDPPRAGVTGP